MSKPKSRPKIRRFADSKKKRKGTSSGAKSNAWRAYTGSSKPLSSEPIGW